MPNTLAPWVLNGAVPINGSADAVLGFTYMLKGRPQVDAAHAWLQGYTLTASDSGVTQTAAYNVTLAFPPGHELDPVRSHAPTLCL